MGSTSILRGFRVSVPTLDNFPEANSQDQTEGIPPFYKDHRDQDPISKLLFSKVLAVDPAADKNRFRVLITSVEGSDEEDNDRMGVYMVTTHEIRGLYCPQEMKKNPQHCDQCEAVFGNGMERMAWFERQQHRRKVHAVAEPLCHFPDY
ncbi:hypothetical protein QBC36DRAFT_387515 [Triangularia setosa]|uniref:C2H2-type domain-containing protein n=1 Tax=Triangularia setosa TaxID=2587417 RepID=A0AAN6W7B0_9PEZI|nr:hypothetical protein QBC36DRAFT_387515 [Podospora setosa]